MPLAIHKPFAVELEPPDEDDEPPDEEDDPPDEDDEPPDEDDDPPDDEDDDPPDEDDEDDEDDEPPDEDDDDVAEAIAVAGVEVLPPQPASRPLMTTATDKILSSSPWPGLMMENRFIASPA